MPVYIVARIDIQDREAYARYEAGFMDILNQHPGQILSVDEAPTVLEGEWPHTRTVLLQFETQQAALDWYQSEAYQNLAKHRFAASTGHVAMLAGLPAA